MKCEKVQKKLPLYLKGLIDNKQKKEIFKHLENCSNCKKALEMEKAITNNLQNLFESEFKESKISFRDIKTQKKHIERKRNLTLFKKFLFGLAASFVIAIGLIFFINRTSTSKITIKQPEIQNIKISTPVINKIVFIDKKTQIKVNKLGNNVYLIHLQGGKND